VRSRYTGAYDMLVTLRDVEDSTAARGVEPPSYH
jgi:hypothetical protein